jgi:uncharacterized protein YkwD
MKKLFLSFAFIVLLGLSISAPLIKAQDPIPAAASTISYLPFVRTQATIEQQVLDLINQHRIVAGCAPLNHSAALQQAAYGHSRDMALNNFFNHKGSNGSSVADRVTQQGYKWSRVGENIAAGQRTPEAVVQAWMNSEGHRKNILNCLYKDMGLGYYYDASDSKLPSGGGPYYHYWTQDFAAP